MKTIYTGQMDTRLLKNAIGETIADLLENDARAVYLDADLMRGLNTADLWKKRPDRVYNCGIQEGNMVAVAAGLCLAGLRHLSPAERMTRSL